MLSFNEKLADVQIRIINAVGPAQLSTACNKCGDQLFADARMALQNESAALKDTIRTVLPTLPIASIHSPAGWEYDVIGIVTAQSVTGTGIFSDVASAFTDLFGAQSGTYNAKLREGENLCATSLRAETLERGGNAIVAVDVDYAEVGGSRAMLMVCMTGTAIKLRNPDRIGPEFGMRTDAATGQATRIRKIESLLSGFVGR
jgi:uncharacterized protein YbjQ (UPF0145 family)